MFTSFLQNKADTQARSQHPEYSSRSLQLLILLTALCGCNEKSPITSPQQALATDPAPAERLKLQLFTEKTLPIPSSLHHGVPDGCYEMPLIMGGGCSIADLDGDGRMELIAVPGSTSPGADKDGHLPCIVLQQLADGRFRDVTMTAGLLTMPTGMGCWLADIDHDGDPDAVTTSSSGLMLLRNDSTNGLIQFTDVTVQSGLSTSRWSTAASFVDIDRDGWLDLFVAHYVDYFPGSQCLDTAGNPDYCGPQAFAGTTDMLLRNLGAEGHPLKFEDITLAAGLGSGAGRGLGSICCDLNGDRLADLYVANDMEPNFLWIQQPDGSFREEASLRGAATDIQGRPQASMGTVLADFDQDGLADLFLTHLRGESNTWYRQSPRGVFSDSTSRTILGESSRQLTGFGVIAEDLNADGFADLCIVNGRVMRSPLQTNTNPQDHWSDYAEHNQIFLGGSDADFRMVNEGDPFLEPEEVSRGLATGDIDNDGDCDILVAGISTPLRLYLNTASDTGNWLRINLTDRIGRRDAIGARVVVTSGDRQFERTLLPYAGYLSSHMPSLFFGLGDLQTVDMIDVYWPDEAVGSEQYPGGAVNRALTLQQGMGIHSEGVTDGMR